MTFASISTGPGGLKLSIMDTPASPAAKGTVVAARPPTLAIGDTLTVVSGRLGGAWVVEDDNGVVYLATPVE